MDVIEDAHEAYQCLLGAGGAAVGERDVLEVVGPDAGRYLQGQLSQDVVTSPVGGSAWSLLLQPSGKVDAWVRVHRTSEEDYAVDVDPGWGDAVAARLRRFLLRTKAEVGEPRRRPSLSVRHGATWLTIGAGGPVAEDPTWLAGVVAGPGVAGVDRIAPEGVDPRAAIEGESIPMVSSAALERHRVAHLVPSMGRELTTDTIPAEGGTWLIETSVSFTKGCYTGQELVARIDSRGNTVPRPVRLLRLDASAVPSGWAPAQGAALTHDGSAAGHVTSAVPALGEAAGPLALGVVARAVPVGGSVVLDGPDGPVDAVVLDAPEG
jgi:folate-binding protein YgfZ